MLVYHPDKSGLPNAAEKAAEINWANEYLRGIAQNTSPKQ